MHFKRTWGGLGLITDRANPRSLLPNFAHATLQVTHEVISDLEASKYQMVEWRSVLPDCLK